jgi:hypothetical protein
MGNSTTKLQHVVDYARTFPELSPVLSTGGFSQEPALTIANDVMTAMFAPGTPWKFNRIRLPFFYTNSFQQDYAFTNLNTLSWLEYAVLIDINSTSQPKDKYVLEVNRDLPETSIQYGRPGQVCWLPNDQLIYGTWGGGPVGEGAASNPGANSIFGPVASTTGTSVTAQPINPIDQIQDPNGNFWRLTNYITASVTLGATQPVWPTTGITFPTFTNPKQTATTVNDGTGIWTAVNPKGQGLRLNPIPSQQGKVWQGRCFGQGRPTQFTSLSQPIDPIPDDFAAYFRRGFVAYSYMHSKDPKVARKFEEQQQLWMQSLKTATASVDKERDNAGIYPTDAIMPAPGSTYLGPANPYFPGGY